MSPYLNTISTILTCEAMCEIVNNTNSNIKHIIQSLKQNCKDAYTHWRQPTTKEEQKLLQYFNKLSKLPVDKIQPITVQLNFCLGLIEELLDHIKNYQRRNAIEKIFYDIYFLYHYYDAEMQDVTSADIAKTSLEKIRKEI